MTGIIIFNKDGLGFTGKIDDITIGMSTKTSVIPMPGINSDVVQKMGASNDTFSVKGYVTVYDRTTGSNITSTQFLTDALNYTGSIYWYSDALRQVLIPAVTVFFSELQWSDKGSRPLERDFVLNLVELR